MSPAASPSDLVSAAWAAGIGDGRVLEAIGATPRISGTKDAKTRSRSESLSYELTISQVATAVTDSDLFE
ncbi:MAG TPA: hypothetical protein VG253_27535, partial [Streptosporangiaceae bacterium]|nr:hypothetical protein [Streptosporangiaceae bacterium]